MTHQNHETPHVTVEVPTTQTYRPLQPVRANDQVQDFKQRTLTFLLPVGGWEDNAFEVVTHLVTPAFISSLLKGLISVGVSFAPPLMFLFAAVLLLGLVSAYWIARTGPEATVLIGVRVFLILIGVVVGVWG
jgi:hypothetical protein